MKIPKLDFHPDSLHGFHFAGTAFELSAGGRELRFNHGQTAVTLRHERDLLVYLNGAYLGSYSDTDQIKIGAAKAAVELGLKAWRAELIILAEAQADDLEAAIKGL